MSPVTGTKEKLKTGNPPICQSIVDFYQNKNNDLVAEFSTGIQETSLLTQSMTMNKVQNETSPNKSISMSELSATNRKKSVPNIDQ